MRSRRNTAILGALIILMLLFEAFRAGSPAGGAGSPVDVVNKYRAEPVNVLAVVQAPMRLFGCLKYCWFANESQSAVVIYRDPSQTNQAPGTFSWDVVGEYGGKWYEAGDSGGGSGAASKTPSRVSFVSMRLPDSSITYRYGIRPGYVMTLGRTLSSDVMQIAVRYDNGTIVAQQPTNGAFALFAQARAACQIRLFGSHGTLLQTLDGSNNQELALEIQRNAPGACQ